MATLYERWLSTVRSSPDRIALREMATGRTWSFAQLADAAEQGGATEGQVVCPLSGRAEFILEMLRTWRDRRVVCPLEPGQARPIMWGDEDSGARSSSAAATSELFDGLHFARPPALKNIAPPGDTLAPATDAVSQSPLPSGIAHLKCTSATTGAPRLVAFTESQLAADADNIVATMGLAPHWPNIGVISLAHSYGFSNLVLPLVLHGVPLILAESPFPESLRKAAELHPAVTLAAVPALWRTWHEAGAIPSNVKLAISAGAPLPLTLEHEVWSASKLKIHNFYGSTETGGIAYDASPVPRDDAACAGRPMVNVEVRIAEDGCIEVRGAAVGQTYWPEPSPDLGAGRFKTSDLGEALADGVYLRGRASEQINVAGRKFSPEQVERVLLEHPAVKECLVFGVPSLSEQRAEMVVACVVREKDVNVEMLRQFLAARLPAWQLPRDWWFVNSFEVSSRGKISRAEWKTRYAEKRGTD